MITPALQKIALVKRYRKILIISAFYLIFGLIIFRHLLAPGMLEYGDTTFPYDGQSLNLFRTQISHIWQGHHFLGFDGTWLGINFLSFTGPVTLLYFIFGDMSTVQYLWYALIFAISGISMFCLTRYLFKKDMIAFTASLFYALSPWIIDRIQGHLHFWQAYAFIPLLFLFYILLLDKKKLRYAIFFAFTSIFIIWALHLTFMAAGIILLYFVYRLLTERERAERKSCLFNSLKVAGITIAFLGFYSLPAFSSLVAGGGTAVTGFVHFAASPASGLFLGQDCTVLNVIRLLGFHSSMFQSSSVTWTLLTFIIPLLWVLPLLWHSNRRETRNIEYFLYILLLIGILLSASPTLMEGALFKGFLYRLPLMNDPDCYVFLVAFAGAPLIGIGVHLIGEKIQNLLRRKNREGSEKGPKLVTAVFLILIVCLISYPLILWKDVRYEQTQYPPEYSELADFLAQPGEDFRVLLLPPYLGVKHRWAPTPIGFIDVMLLPKPYYGPWTAEATPQASRDFSVLTTNAFLQDNPSSQLANILRLANAKYIVLRNDLESWPPHFPLDPQEMESYFTTLDSQQNIYLEQKFGDIYVYKIDDEYFLPHIYAASEATLVDGGLNEMSQVVISDGFVPGKPALFLSDQVALSQWEFIQGHNGSSDYPPVITFQKLDPTKYIAHVKAKGPFYLVFSESFSPQWHAYVNEGAGQTNWIGALFQKPIPEHFLVNGYANAWYVDPGQLGIEGEEFTITLYYWPQSLFYIGWITTGITFAGCVSYLIWDWRRGKHKGSNSEPELQ